jgi:hypothetical protein
VTDTGKTLFLVGCLIIGTLAMLLSYIFTPAVIPEKRPKPTTAPAATAPPATTTPPANAPD